MILQEKIKKLKARVDLLSDVKYEEQRVWGLMSPQHMIEHLGMVFVVSAKGRKSEVVLEPEVARKAKSRFFSSYYPFPKNVRMPGMRQNPVETKPLRFTSLDEAKERLHSAIEFFLRQLDDHPEQTATHGYFGNLTMAEWLNFHIKHVEHHLQQYGLLPRDEKISTLEKLLHKVKTKIHEDTPPLWGKMNAQQMVEHLSLVFALSTGKFDFPYPGTKEEAKLNWEGFLASEDPWKDVFKAVNFGDPRPPRKASLAESKKLLQKSFLAYLDYCECHPDAVHPQFYLGELTVDKWRQVHIKHMKHHLAQFGIAS